MRNMCMLYENTAGIFNMHSYTVYLKTFACSHASRLWSVLRSLTLESKRACDLSCMLFIFFCIVLSGKCEYLKLRKREM